MSLRISSRLSLMIVISIVTGAIAGIFAPETMASLSVFGSLFISAFRILLLPIILSSVIIGVVGLGNMTKLGRSLLSTLTYFILTTVVAVVLGVVLAIILHPGVGVDASGLGLPSWAKSASQVRFDHILGGLLPQNPISALIDGNFLGLILFALLLGAVLSQMGTKGKPVVDFFSTLLEGTLGVMKYILIVAPLGLFALVGSAIGGHHNNLGDMFRSLGMFSLTTLVGMVLLFVVILPTALKLWGGRSPFAYLTKLHPALLIAFGTGSSAVAYPVAYSNVTEDDNVDSRASSIVLSLGYLVNLQGTALYLTIATLFVAQVSNVSLSFMDMVTIGAVSAIVSMGSASLPNVSLFGLAVTMSIVGFPPSSFAIIGLLVIVDWFFDRCRAVVNIWGDAVGAAIIGETFEFKTARGGRTVSARSRTTARSSSSSSRKDDRSSRTGRDSSRRTSSETRTARKTRSTTTKSRTTRKDSSSTRSTGSTRKTASTKRSDRPSKTDGLVKQAPPARTERSSKDRRSTVDSKPTVRERRTVSRRKTVEQNLVVSEAIPPTSIAPEKDSVSSTQERKIPPMPAVPPLPTMPSSPLAEDFSDQEETIETAVPKKQSKVSIHIEKTET